MSPPPIEHNGWTAIEDEEEDSDGFWTPLWWAEKDGERKLLHHSRFHFTMTQERFAYLVDAGFPPHPPRPEGRPLGPWSNEDIDEAIQKLRSNT